MTLFEKILNLIGFEKTVGAVITRWRIKRNLPTPTPPVVSINTTDPIVYLINDPSTPSLIKNVTPPTYTTAPLINVKDYKGGGYERTSAEGQAGSVFVTTVNTLNYYNSKTEKQIPKWPGASTLQILPRAGVNLNAFYNRRTLSFFFANSPKIGGSIFLCDSSEIVAHELGHAILDAYRPDMWNVAFLEVAALHEAFADFTGMMHLLLYDEIIEHVLNETQGDLRKSNVASKSAEQFSGVLYRIADQSAGLSPDYLRNGVNDFIYVNPTSLPKEGPHSAITAESHSFSRIMSGALYEIFAMMYESIKESGVDASNSVKQARDLITSYVLKSIQNVPINANVFSSFSKTMLWADVTMSNRKYHDKMQEIFLRRNLVTVQLMMLSAPKCDNEENIVKYENCRTIRLSDVLLTAQSNNPLYEVELEVPSEQAYLYDNDKCLYDTISVSEEDSLGAAQDMVNYLYATNMVSEDGIFGIENGHLIRRRT